MQSQRILGWIMLVVLLSLTGFGCVSGRFLPAVRETFSATNAKKVVVKLGKTCPANVKIIGSVIVDASEPITQGGMVERLRGAAAQGGGHGICKLRYRKTKGGSLLPGAGEYDPSGFKSATCLVFRYQ